MTEVNEHIGEGRQRRFRPYPEYTDSGIEWLGEIPAHWQSLALGHLTISRCDGPFGSGLKSEHYTESGVRVVRLQNIGWAEFTDLDAAYLDDAYARRLGDHSVKGGDVLIAGLGDDGHPVGRACVAPVEIEPAMVKADCFRFRLARERILPRYAAFQLSATAAAVAGRYATGATRTRMNLATSASRKITLPPMKEQEAIAAFLDRETEKIDALVTRKERLIELLQEKRAALITRAVTRGLDPLAETRATGSRVFPVVPKDWNLWKMRRLIGQVRRPVVVRADGNYQEIGVRSWGKGIFHKEPVKGVLPGDKSVFWPKPGDFVLNIVFAWEGAVGVVSEREAGMIASHRFPMFRPSGHVDLDYLLMVLQSDQGRRLMEVNSPGAAGRNKTLRIGQFLEEEVPLPSIETQQEIVAGFREKEGQLAAIATKTRRALDYLKEFRTALISAAVTGKIDVRKATPR